MIDEICLELEELPEPSTPAQKRAFKRQANALVNKKLSTSDFKVMDDPIKAANALAKKFKGDRLWQLEMTHTLTKEGFSQLLQCGSCGWRHEWRDKLGVIEVEQAIAGLTD